MILAAALLAGCGPAVAPSEPLPAVDGARALEETARVVALGPRVAGTAGAERAAAYLVERLAARVAQSLALNNANNNDTNNVTSDSEGTS